MFRGDKEVDYHGILQWAAEEAGINSAIVQHSSTYALEKAVAEKYFAKLWEGRNMNRNMNIDDLGESVNDLREAIELISENPEATALLSGAALWLGPVGLAVLAAGGVAGGIWLAGSESDTVSAFIMTVKIIKTSRYKK